MGSTRNDIKLSQDRFEHWRTSIRFLLQSKRCDGLLNFTPTEETEEIRAKMGKASFLILNTLSDEDISFVQGYDATPKMLFDRICSKYESSAELFRKLFTTEKGKGDEIIGKVRQIKISLEALKAQSKWDEMFVYIALSKFEETLDPLVKQILAAEKPITNITELETRVCEYIRSTGVKENLKNVQNESPLALNILNKEKKFVCEHCKKRGHTIDKCYIKNPALNPRHAATKRKSDQGSNISGFISMYNDENQQNLNKSTWIVNSGAQKHSTPHKDILQNFVADRSEVSTGAGPAMYEGYGTVRGFVKTSNGKLNLFCLENVHYLPTSPVNLLSISHLGEKMEVSFKAHTCIFKQNGAMLFKLTNHTSTQLFQLDIIPENEQCYN